MNFWTGIIIGVFVGAIIGIVVAGVLAASKRSDDEEIFQLGRYPMDEAALDDAVQASSLWSSLDRPQSDIVQPHAQGFQNS
jgi:hypothetical protein